jgi:hypothetical protein
MELQVFENYYYYLKRNTAFNFINEPTPVPPALIQSRIYLGTTISDNFK